MRINPNLYRYTEQALREYPDVKRRLRILEAYLEAPTGGGDRVDGGDMISEQERIVHRKMKDAELRSLMNQLKPLHEFWDSLNSSDRALVELRYFEGFPWSEVAREMSLSEEACRRRRAPRLIKKAAYLIFGDLVPR